MPPSLYVTVDAKISHLSNRYFDKCLYLNGCDSAILSGKLTKFGI